MRPQRKAGTYNRGERVMWTLILFGMIGPPAGGTGPATAAFYQIDFPSEQLCLAAKAQISRDFSLFINGGPSTHAQHISGSCIKRQ
jgi:hypothetical protein